MSSANLEKDINLFSREKIKPILPLFSPDSERNKAPKERRSISFY